MRTFKLFTSMLLAITLTSCAAMDLEISPAVDPFKVVYSKGTYNIYLSSMIVNADAYTDLIVFINSHQDEDEINIYLSGVGGSADSVLNLINTMRASKTKFNMIVYGNVFSGHAFLALGGTTLTVESINSVFLFHRPAYGAETETLDQFCSKQKGTDRGQSKAKKCKQILTMADKSFNNTVMFNLGRLLTSQELKNYYLGEDVLINGKTLIDRLTKLHILGY